MSTNSTNHRGHRRPQEKWTALKPQPWYRWYHNDSQVTLCCLSDVFKNWSFSRWRSTHVNGVKTLQLMHTQGISIRCILCGGTGGRMGVCTRCGKCAMKNKWSSHMTWSMSLSKKTKMKVLLIASVPLHKKRAKLVLINFRCSSRILAHHKFCFEKLIFFYSFELQWSSKHLDIE